MAEMAAAAWAFIKAAFVAVGSGTATAGQVATVVAVNVAGSVALSAATSVLMKPDVGGRAPGEWLADPNAGIPFAIGDRIGVAGNIVYKNTFGKDNEYKGIVTILSGAGPISAYLGFTADREPIAFAGEAATGRYGGEMWMQRRLGEQPDTALTSPAAITYQKLPDWGPNHRLSGKAAFMWTLRMDSKFSVYPQGEPAPITVLRGIKGYDHRYDSTMPGGSGPCRLNDRATYRTITNPAIADLNWCLGLRENGKVVGGLGVSPAGIDWSAYTRAANVADANAWTIAAYPRSDESKSEVRAGMLQAAGAVISRRAGLVSCVTRGAPKSPVMTISAADTAGPIELDTAANVLNRYNTMTPRYLSEAHEWMLTPAAPVSSSVYVEEDRGRVRSDQRDYPYVPNAKQAAELCALDIAHSREGVAGRWPLKAYCRELEPGDVFTVDEPGLLLDGMDMLVLDRDYDPETDTPYVVFVSETPGKVAWALGQQANPSPTPALSARHDLNAPDPDAFDVVIVPPSPEGVSMPVAEVVIDIDNARAEDLIVEVGPTRDGPWRVAKTVTIVDAQLRVPVNELAPGEVFWVALSYRSADDGPSPKTIKGPYEAPDLIAAGVTDEAAQKLLDEATKAVDEKIAEAAEKIEKAIDLGGVFEDQDDLAEAILKLGRGMSVVQELIERLGRTDGLPVAVVLNEKVTILEEADRLEVEARLEMGAALGESLAAAEQSISVVATDLSAEVQSREVLAGRVGANEGAIVTERNLRIAGDQAEASARQALAVQVENNRATAEQSINVVATDLSAEVTARQALGVRVDNAEGAIVAEAQARANQDSVWLQNFNLMGARRGDNTGWVLNQSTVDISDEGTLASVLSGLRAADGANASSITNLQQVSSTQASQIATLTNTTNGQTASITVLQQVTEGIGARWTLSLNSNDQITALVADGATRSVVFNAASLAIVDDGNGLSYQPATGRLKIIRGDKKTVLGAGGSLILWAGSTSITDGAETVDNGDLGIGSGDAWFGGRTLSGPFDSGGSGGIVHLTESFQNIAEVTKTTRQGAFLLWPEFYHQGGGVPDGEGYAEYALDWQIVSANLGGGDVQVLKSGSNVGQGGFGPSSWGPMLFAPPSDFSGIAHSKSGQRRIILQARMTRGLNASLTNYAVKGFYAA